MTTVFRSKVDGKFKLVAFVVPCVALAVLATTPRVPGSALWVPGIISLLVSVLIAWVVASTYYEFDHADLVTHSGPFSWRIPLESISSVRESDSVRSGPALSMDRLEVVFNGGKILLISPADKAGFLALLHRRAPHLAPPL